VIDWVSKVENDYTEFYLEEIRKENTNERDLNEFYYKFRAIRLKDEETRKEFLKLTAYVRNSKEETEYTEEVSVMISMRNLDQGLIDLREYGIIFSDDNIRLKLKRKIESVYRSIKVELNEEIGEEKNERFKDFLAQVNERLILEESNKDKNGNKESEVIRNNLFYVSTTIFDELAIDCEYEPFEIRSLRRKLKKENIIVTDDKRYTKLLHCPNKVIRAIAFHIDKIKEIEDKQGEHI